MTSRTTWPVLVAITWAVQSESALAQRVQSAPSQRTQQECVISSQLLNRVAAAVDGYNRGERVWVITTCSDTATVTSTTTSEVEANRSRGTALVLGPYGAKAEKAAVTLGLDQTTFSVVVQEHTFCWHEQQTSIMRPTHCNEGAMPRLGDVTGILVQFRLRNGQRLERTLPPGVDALFLSYSGLEKFAFPYYQRILGLSGVAAMRANLFQPRR